MTDELEISKKGSLCDFDFRLNQLRTGDDNKYPVIWTLQEIAKCLIPLCKNFVGQLEKGDEGTLHFCFSIRLKKKTTLNNLKLDLFPKTFNAPLSHCPQWVAPTLNGVHTPKKFNYETYNSKIQTRQGDIITDLIYKDEIIDAPEYIPIQYRDLLNNLFPYQKFILENKPEFNILKRCINVIIDTSGNNGKSTIAHLSRLFYKGIVLPPINDAKELMQAMADQCINKGVRRVGGVFIDLPRGMNKKQTNNLFIGIEQIKSGYLVDVRHSYKEWDIDAPIVWVFTNSMPDLSLVSKDRWRLWTINEDKELISFKL